MGDGKARLLEPPKPEPLEELVALYDAYAQAVCGRPLEDADDLAERLSAPAFDLAKDARACYADGHLTGWVQVTGPAPYTELHLWGAVHPQHIGQGIGTQLVRWAQQRAGEIATRAPAGKSVVLRSELVGADPRAVPLFEGLGFSIVRHYQELILRLVGPPPAPAVPVGIRIRTYRLGDDLRAICWANRQAFRDHWGYVETPFEESLERFQAMVHAPRFRPEDWFIAYDGDEVVGMALCRDSMPEDPNMAWVDSLSVRRHWRRRGIGLALLRYAIQAFYMRGKTSVALGVDTQSLTGATRLYEKAGMEPYQVFHVVETVVRAGASPETTS
jgi:mycothiol synthase